MTATLLAMFIEKGHLTWETPLGAVFPPAYFGRQDAYQRVTLGMLTAHMSGLPGDMLTFNRGILWNQLWDVGLDPMHGRQLVAQTMLSSPPSHPPGSTFEYSNAGYIIVGAVLERVTGKAWEVLMREHVFGPLGMITAGFGPTESSLFGPLGTPPQPCGHKSEGGHPVPVTGRHADNPPTLGPAGTVHCSLDDWMKFCQFHVDGVNGRPPLLSRATFTKLHTPYPGQNYTYGGWAVSGHMFSGPVLQHTGSNTMNYSCVQMEPSRGVIYLGVCNFGSDAARAAVTEEMKSLFFSDTHIA